MALVFFGYANFVLIGYYKDVAADRATGYRTLPVVFGRGRAALVSDGFALLALLGCGVAVSAAWAGTSFTPATALGLALVAAGAAVSGLAQWQVHEVETDAEAHRALAPAVHAYVLLLAGVAALHKPGWALALAFFYLGFVLWLGQRPMRQQI